MYNYITTLYAKKLSSSVDRRRGRDHHGHWVIQAQPVLPSTFHPASMQLQPQFDVPGLQPWGVIQGMRDWDSGPAEITLESLQRI